MKKCPSFAAAAIGVFLIIGPLCVQSQTTGTDTVKKELAKLEGTWQVVAVEENGVTIPADKLQEAMATVTLKGDRHTLEYAGKSQGTVTIKIDPSAKPKRYDLVITEGAEKGRTQLGIYEIDGDSWKLCLNKLGTETRPAEFKTTPGSGLVVVTMKKSPRK